MLEVIEIACCHKGLYIGLCKGAVCIPHEEYLVLLVLEGLNVACWISQHGVSGVGWGEVLLKCVIRCLHCYLFAMRGPLLAV